MNLKLHATDLWNGLVELAKLAVAAPAEFRSEVGLIVTSAASLGLLSAAKAPAEADALTAVILLLAALVLAATKLIQAFKAPAK
jgi:hypothetical protein